MAINHYQLLGIPEDADLRRIKAAYRSMAKRCHPDTNQGSAAAAELFLKLNEAYRVLSNEPLRKLYNQQLPRQPEPQPSQPRPAAPQQKFNRFLNSLLDAIFAAPEPRGEEPLAAPPPRHKPAGKVRRQPDFNFYYYLAMEQGKNPYRCDEDGVYRRENKEKARPPGYKRTPASSFVLLLLSGFWKFFLQ